MEAAVQFEEGTCLLAVVRDGRQDGAQRLDAHGDVQQVAGEEEVVVVAQQGHDRVPAEIQEGLRERGRRRRGHSHSPGRRGGECSRSRKSTALWSLTPSVKTTPNFQI